MSYYTRLLSPSANPANWQRAVENLKDQTHPFKCREIDRDAGGWISLEITDLKGTPMFRVEKNPVFEGSMAEDELQDMAAFIEDALPKSGLDWLLNYFRRVKTVYAFEHLSALEDTEAFDVLTDFRFELFAQVGGIVQADNEGFTNEDGYHILWQFTDDQAFGPWPMGVLVNGEWRYFEMQLDNLKQREAFLKGEVPKGVKLLTD